MKVCILGLGYIGLPTATIIAQQKHEVVGVDINHEIIKVINSGKAHISETGLNEALLKVINSGFFKASLKPVKSDIYIIAVPTPISKEENRIPEPNIEFIFSAIKSITKFLSKGNTVIIESTSPIGTTQKISDYIFTLTGLNSEDINYAYCPERVIPGMIMKELKSNSRIIGGLTKKASCIVKDFYSTFSEGSIKITNSQTAEMVKLVENAYRDVNIAFANEISIFCNHVGINSKDLIELSNYHPRVNILSPGIGVGGHCIAIDPWFLIAEEPNLTNLMQMARKVNNNKTEWVISQIIQSINNFKKNSYKDICVGFLGLSYKPNVDDLRESPALKIVKKIVDLNIKTIICDPHFKNIEGLEISSSDQLIKKADIIVCLVAHDYFKKLDFKGKKIIDFCGAFD